MRVRGQYVRRLRLDVAGNVAVAPIVKHAIPIIDTRQRFERIHEKWILRVAVEFLAERNGESAKAAKLRQVGVRRGLEFTRGIRGRKIICDAVNNNCMGCIALSDGVERRKRHRIYAVQTERCASGRYAGRNVVLVGGEAGQ